MCPMNVSIIKSLIVKVTMISDGSRRTFLRIVARILPRLSSQSLAFRFMSSLCECICLCLLVLLFACLHTYPGINKALGQCFICS